MFQRFSFFIKVLGVFFAIQLFTALQLVGWPGFREFENQEISSKPFHDELIQPHMNVNFDNIENEKIKQSFLKVLERYTPLHQYDITLIQKRIKGSTMQAQPIISLKGLFTGVKKYRIKLAVNVRDSEELRVSKLPPDVLTGWFAHELGHIMDYESRSNAGMMIYGLRYILSEKFMREAEYQADSIAIEYGFSEEIIATKRYILENEFLTDDYKNKIRKFYMPIKGVEMCAEDKLPLDPKVKLSTDESN